jgi:nicotinate phosphoribosyltransferase
VEEPEIVFPLEPILRVSGNIIEAQILESVLLNKINLATTLATKAARVVISAKTRAVYDFSLRRTQGQEASLAVAKYSYIAGAKGTSNVLAGFLYKIPIAGTMAHSFVMAFERELESFLAFSESFPARSILLVDTYDTKGGIRSAVKTAIFLKKEGIRLTGIRLDSGNLLEGAKYAREAFDKEGFIDAIIVASGNLDEFKIEKLVKQGAPIDAFGVGTHMGCSSDLPYTDVIYKLVEVKDAGAKFVPTMKVSKSKATMPSRKQVFRQFSINGIMQKDIIGIHDEKIQGRRLLKKMMHNGVNLYKEKNINEKRKIFLDKIKSLPEKLLGVKSSYEYPVETSNKLLVLASGLKEQIRKKVSEREIFLDIDTQYDFIYKKGALYVKGAEKIVKNLKILTALAEKNNILIVSSQDTHTKDDPEFGVFGPHCISGTPCQNKIKETLIKKYKIIKHDRLYTTEQFKSLSRVFSQLVFEKNVLDVFSNQNFPLFFEAIFPDKVYIYGVVTEYCVKEAITGLIKYGFTVCVITDAIKGISQKEKDKLFVFWKKKGVEFLTVKEVCRRISNKYK